MKYIKEYNLYKESNVAYSIYNFFDGLHSYHEMPMERVKFWSERFVGKGVFDKVSIMADDIFEKFEGIDLDELEMRFTDFSDKYEFESNFYFAIISHDWNKEEYNSAKIFNGNFVKKDKENLVRDIIREIIKPTLEIGSWKDDEEIRKTEDQIYVNDEKWNCLNFDIDNYDIDTDRKRLKKEILKEYSVNKFFDCYAPALYIKIGGNGITMNLKEIESRLDDQLPNLLFDIPHKEIIWDSSRFLRKFDDNINIYDYTLKIILE